GGLGGGHRGPPGAADAADVGGGRRLRGDQQVRDAEQCHAGDQEQAAVDERQPGADGQPVHGIRYPTPGSVSTTGGSPNLRRSLKMVIRTALVNGSALSSHAFSSNW